MRLTSLVITFLVSLFLSGCGQQDETNQMVQQAVAIESSDECHLCGMIITNFPGPKGQLYSKGINGNMKFCSTRDMFAFILDPENQHNIQRAFVHDMAVTPWGKPNDDIYIDAKQAFYVVGHNQYGAMGPTLASFSRRSDADTFASQMGGQVFQFEEINMDIMTGMINESQALIDRNNLHHSSPD